MKLIALLLLLAPVETPSPSYLWPLRSYIQDVAVSMEVLDTRERIIYLENPANFAFDMRILRRRVDDTIDAPPASDARRFPNESVAHQLLTFNNAYECCLECRQKLALHRWEEFEAALMETRQLALVWRQVRDVGSNYHVVPHRLALKHLRETLGIEAYYNGVLPPHVPIWRFVEMDR